jgi:type II secretory pathway predicted ATPase ExeA
MYLSYWGLSEIPFKNTPDPKFIYYSSEHEEALVRLLYVVTEGRGGLLLTGEYGCGKTLLSRVFLKELNESKFLVALITNPNLSDTDFLKEVLYQLGVETKSREKVDLLHELDKVVLKTQEGGRSIVVIVDEAQQVMDENTFEEIRLLLNYQQYDNFMVSLVLMGQPELRGKVAAIPQLKQRLGMRFHLKPLSKEECFKYIEHRLVVAGQTRFLFEDDAKEAVFEFSKGVPRDINNICDMALLTGFGYNAKTIDSELITMVVEDMSLDDHED